jgi:hypothetical protein
MHRPSMCQAPIHLATWGWSRNQHAIQDFGHLAKPDPGLWELNLVVVEIAFLAATGIFGHGNVPSASVEVSPPRRGTLIPSLFLRRLGPG